MSLLKGTMLAIDVANGKPFTYLTMVLPQGSRVDLLNFAVWQTALGVFLAGTVSSNHNSR